MNTEGSLYPEAVTQRCSVKKVFLEISQNSRKLNETIGKKWVKKRQKQPPEVFRKKSCS